MLASRAHAGLLSRGGRGPRAGLPLRRSLLGRLLGVFALVAACSVAATAWLATQTTTAALRQEQGQALAGDSRIYDALIGYAATHPRWDGVDQVLRNLASQYDVRIILTTPNRQLLGDSAKNAHPDQLPARPAAVVDPLNVDLTISGAGGTPSPRAPEQIDARAVGPFRLTQSEQDQLQHRADEAAACLRGQGENPEVVEGPSGRPSIQPQAPAPDGVPEEATCPDPGLSTPTATERRALQALTGLTNACLSRQGIPGVVLNLDYTWQSVGGAADTPVAVDQSLQNQDAVASCIGTARREQLSPYVARPALLFISDPGRADGTALTLPDTARIATAAALVLLVTIGISVVTGCRLVRPLRQLTAAAQRMKSGTDTTPVTVGADNEIGRLAAAFNDMAEHRRRLEVQREALVSDVAHELRTPLSNIRGWLEATQDGLTEPNPDLIASLLEEAVQLQHIIDDLQDLAQADAGALRLHLEPVDVTDLLHQIAAVHQIQAARASITLTVSAPDDLLTLTADPIRLRQVVTNLLTNALRHTPQGGQVHLCARTDSNGPTADTCDPRARTLTLEVTDTGSGIAVQDLPRVFDRFWRADRSRSRHTGGSGLGLAIVRKLTEAHNGTVTAASEEGTGATFTLRFPL
ncbi:sensor histidine kinase [Streptacidiphilus rugosus]|uniref:sensor histidine kinase n=1 Tax=Streptacidiphilus rugosus TaxID=405783 RepID=UPI00056A5B10|nr:HAMP domain-containing sensor histidine kinase [Streptacidiphilus rugosus]